VTQPWERRMAHERDWRDAGVEAGCRRPPSAPDGHGFLAQAGDIRKFTPELDRLFAAKGHDSMIFEACRCSRDRRPPDAPAIARPPA